MNPSLRRLYAVWLVPMFALGASLHADPNALTSAAETLPASSPYGEAVVFRNIPYVPSGEARQNFDLYLPKEKGATPLPFVVWMHGGAWEMSSKEWDNVKYLVKNGYAIATVDYRLAPQSTFPAQIQDCNAAMNFLVTHADTYGLDSKRFVVGGASAGGHLCLLLGMARHEKGFGADPAVRPLAILDFFGPTDLNGVMDDLRAAHSAEGLKLGSRALPQFLGSTLDDFPARAKTASPLNYVSTDTVPVLILQGTADALVPSIQSERLHAKLDEAKVRNQLILVAGAPHDGPSFETPARQTQVLDFLHSVMP